MLDLQFIDHVPWLFEEFGKGIEIEQQIEDIRLNPNQDFLNVSFHKEDPN